MRRRLVVLGTGGHASVVIDAARAAGFDVLGCLGPQHPSFGRDFCPYIGSDEVLPTLDRSTVSIAIGVGSTGDASLRRRLFERAHAIGLLLEPIIHPRSVISTHAKIGVAVQVMGGAAVNSFAVIGENAIVNTGAVVEHHADIGDDCHVAPGAVICGGVTLGRAAHIGAGAIVMQGLTVGREAVVAAGAVVVRSVLPGNTVRGVPAT